MDLIALLVLALVLCGLLIWVLVTYWAWIVPLVILGVAVRLAWMWLRHWLAMRQIRVQTAKAKQQLDAAYRRSQTRMEQLAREHHLRKGITK
ncbi:hypothetical protein KIF24_24205 [Micromonospora sp. Llam7]|uniref:hypothetical protein n=1 Tax=Micromonospora tarapacensis TaxID=2835305 RepID=UPI001C82D044|nr:hypothetical protein [Micromonospora tarapacensis]MBX7268816.1 hypothetical protein [Micromonospora tarapacensis]